ncbi:MAG: type III pantothenate kinase [Candidatus Azobacteroides sp.]|nr:type III pantothenate kinase [Candidatus Azobacteroides sp.]
MQKIKTVNLIIDQGNSVVKIALIKHNEIIYFGQIRENIIHYLKKIITEYPVQQAILSSVSKENKELNHFLEENIPLFYVLNSNTSLPIKICYKTPETLGNDRLAGAIGAHSIKPDKNLLIIDAGTAITYDFIDKNGNFYGGNISPGLYMRFKALHYFTAKLPLVSSEGEIPSFGDTTETAIRSGVVNGIIYEMDSYINEFKKKYDDVFVFLTGGDTFFLAEKLKNSIFADTKLLIKGLNRILNYNANF